MTLPLKADQKLWVILCIIIESDQKSKEVMNQRISLTIKGNPTMQKGSPMVKTFNSYAFSLS